MTLPALIVAAVILVAAVPASFGALPSLLTALVIVPVLVGTTSGLFRSSDRTAGRRPASPSPGAHRTPLHVSTGARCAATSPTHSRRLEPTLSAGRLRPPGLSALRRGHRPAF